MKEENLNYIPKSQFLITHRISRWTFNDWVSKRGLPIIKIGYRTFIPFSEYTHWVKTYETNIPQKEEIGDVKWKPIFGSKK